MDLFFVSFPFRFTGFFFSFVSHTSFLSKRKKNKGATLSLSVLFSRSGAVLEHRVLRRGGFRSVVFQVHPGRVLVGRGHHDDSRIRWHEVTNREQPGKTPTKTNPTGTRTIPSTHVLIPHDRYRYRYFIRYLTLGPCLWLRNTYRHTFIDRQTNKQTNLPKKIHKNAHS